MLLSLKATRNIITTSAALHTTLKMSGTIKEEKNIFFTFKDSNLAICRLSFIFATVFISLPSIFLAFLPCIFFAFLCVPKQEHVAMLGLDQLTSRVKW